MKKVEGGCYCGEIRYWFTEPRGSALCYCENCRKVSGAQSLAWVGVAKKNVEVFKGEPTTYLAPNGTTWSFCANCGTTLFWQPKKDGPFTVTTGSLDDPSEFPPTSTTYDEDRIPWEPPLITQEQGRSAGE
jgi:hypothetical protein